MTQIEKQKMKVLFQEVIRLSTSVQNLRMEIARLKSDLHEIQIRDQRRGFLPGLGIPEGHRGAVRGI